MPSASRVLHIVNGEFYAGAERVQELLAARLPEHGFEVFVGCLKRGRFRQHCRCNRAKVVDFPMHSKLDLRQAFVIARYIIENRFSLIHTHTPRTAMLGYVASRLAGVPLVHHLHSPTAQDTEHALRNTLNAFIETAVMRRAARVIAVSTSLSQYLSDRGVPARSIHLVLNGVPGGALPSPCRIRNGRPVTIGTVGLFRPRKGVEILMQAVHRLTKEGLDVRLEAVGPFETPGYQRQVLGLAKALDLEHTIEWTGFVEDPYPRLRRFDVFVLPSLFGEGLPMVVLEAMANGVPIVASNVGGMRDAIPDDRFGMLVEPGDVEQLADGIASLIGSPDRWERVREKAYDRQRQLLSDSVMAENVATVYRQVLGSAGVRSPTQARPAARALRRS